MRRWVCLALATLGACSPATARGPGPAGSPRGERWVASWATSPQPADPALELTGQTLRQIVHTSLGGARVRVRLSNAYGETALDVASVHVAIRARGPAIAAASDRALTFGGERGVHLAPGALAVSDPVALTVAAASDLAVSMYLPGAVHTTTQHAAALQTSYVSAAGDFTGAETLASPTAIHAWYLLAGVDVEGTADARAIVALGDSITDGHNSTPDTNHRWPSLLADRLRARGHAPRAVVNAGISGNAIVSDVVGSNALARLDRDVLAQPGAGYVIVLEGINDIGANPPEHAISAAQIIAAHRQIILRAHELGLKAIGGTMTPFEDTTFEGFYDAANEAKREAVNHWIRTGGTYDAVIDFDRAARDPAHPARLRPAFDSGDHLHPNDAGYQAMADAIDLSLFDAAP